MPASTLQGHGEDRNPRMSPTRRRLPVGAELQPEGGTHFRVWAPRPRRVTLQILPRDGEPFETAAEREPDGYYSVHLPGVSAGDRYRFCLDGQALADPASRFQPEGQFGPSEVVDPSRFAWTDAAWRGVEMRGQVIYEMHVGSFTPEGTWRAAMAHMPKLVQTGITLLELMPVADFPGRFGWGYDGVFPYAPTRLYGTPDDFRAFVDRAHALGLGVILDVVYNHLGPDGCVFAKYAPAYFTTKYPNEWGEPLNFDGPDGAPVREYFSANAAYWIDEYHLDGLRLDATQSIHDGSEEHILRVIARRARAAAHGRSIVLVAENEPQEVRMVQPLQDGGFGLDAVWNDDFHHSAVVQLTGRREAYYTDHRGTPQEFVSAAKYGYLFQGQRYAWQRKNRGTRTTGISPERFVNFVENHDQLANSGDGSRLHARTAPGRYRAMTALVLLLPGTPMLFQGQEFGATTPFLYFADHNPELAEAVQRGRAEFVSQFTSLASPEVQRTLPVPHDPATFARCALNWREYETRPQHRRLHHDLLAVRREDVAFRQQRAGAVDGSVLGPEAFVLHYFTTETADERLLMVNFGVDLATPALPEPLVAPPPGFDTWVTRWSSEDPEYGGLGIPEVVNSDGWRVPGHSAIVLRPAEQSDGRDEDDR
jgi:maltooligosyltrehalose trehalohydrolase